MVVGKGAEGWGVGWGLQHLPDPQFDPRICAKLNLQNKTVVN